MMSVPEDKQLEDNIRELTKPVPETSLKLAPNLTKPEVRAILTRLAAEKNLDIYEHYKPDGGFYLLLQEGVDVDGTMLRDQDDSFIPDKYAYLHLWPKKQQIFFRNIKEFHETVSLNGVDVPRFKLLRPATG